jgi:hypothetical protein
MQMTGYNAIDSGQGQLAALDLNFGCHNKKSTDYELLSLLNEIANQRRKIIFNRRLDGTIVK